MTTITMLSDFGLSDGYVASMKGVILSIFPEVRIVDISHLIERHDIIAGAFILASVVDYFPKDTVHLAVIDPGVGTQRRGIVITSRNCMFIGPDNGILVPAAQKKRIVEVRSISNKGMTLEHLSMTFHGRDLFAPVAAYLAAGEEIEKVGPKIDDYTWLQLPESTVKDRVIKGQIIHRDGFGNLITNILEENLQEINAKESIMVEIKDKKMPIKLRPSYGYGEPGELLATVGGTGFLEISVNQGDASRYTGAGKRTEIRISAT